MPKLWMMKKYLPLVNCGTNGGLRKKGKKVLFLVRWDFHFLTSWLRGVVTGASVEIFSIPDLFLTAKVKISA